MFTPPVAGTHRDIRFTRGKHNTTLYATALGWPADTLSISTLATGRIDLNPLQTIHPIGPADQQYVPLNDYRQDEHGLHITLPSAPPLTAPAYVLKLTFAGPIPSLRP